MKTILEQTWWDENLNSRMEEFLNWIGASSAESKVYFRNFLKTSPLEFKNCLDVGCGPATEYFGFKEDGIILEYTGVDSSKILNDLNRKKGIPMIMAEAHSIPANEAEYDLVFSRHVLEHQLNFEPILAEMIRIGKKLVVHIFFIKPSELSQEFIWTDLQKDNLYHNRYNIQDMETFLHTHPKVKKFTWHDINKQENMIAIELH